jgi:DNA-binding transcriptional LysR family regulator
MLIPGAFAKHLRDNGFSIQIETAQIDSMEVAERLASGEIDFAIGYLSNLGKTIASASLFHEHYVCLTRQDYSENGEK